MTNHRSQTHITDTGSNVVGPNTSILISATNDASNSAKLSIEAAWVEVPESEMPE